MSFVTPTGTLRRTRAWLVTAVPRHIEPEDAVGYDVGYVLDTRDGRQVRESTG
jgi:hypothetical protein